MKTLSQKKYNPTLDALKGIACIAVVFMHCEFPGYIGTLIQCISRFCVPLFFMVSGYYCFSESPTYTKPIKPKIIHVLKITIGASIFYGALTILYYFMGWKGYYGLSLSSKGLVYWIVLNQPFFGSGQMWFLWALLYTYPLFATINLLGSTKKILILLPVLCLSYIFLAQGLHLAGIRVPNFIYRNAYIEGLAFFLMGYAIHVYQYKIKLYNNTLIWIVVIFTLLCPIERMLMERDFGVNICTFPQVAAMFIFAIKNPDLSVGKIRWLTVTGKKHSMMVYILHPFVWHIFQQVYAANGIDENMLMLYLMPILVVAFTFLLSNFYNIAKEKSCLMFNKA